MMGVPNINLIQTQRQPGVTCGNPPDRDAPQCLLLLKPGTDCTAQPLLLCHATQGATPSEGLMNWRVIPSDTPVDSRKEGGAIV